MDYITECSFSHCVLFSLFFVFVLQFWHKQWHEVLRTSVHLYVLLKGDIQGMP